MTRPASVRERRLLSKLGTESRWFVSQSKISSDLEAEDFVKEENGDMLGNHAHDLLSSLSEALDSQINGAYTSPNINRLEQARSEYLQSTQALLDRYVFTFTDWKPVLHFAGMHRLLDDCLSHEDRTEARFCLDYLPILRTLAVIDKAHSAVLEYATETSKSKRKRSTRSSHGSSSVFHVASIGAPCIWNTINAMEKTQFTSILADGHLRYKP